MHRQRSAQGSKPWATSMKSPLNRADPFQPSFRGLIFHVARRFELRALCPLPPAAIETVQEGNGATATVYRLITSRPKALIRLQTYACPDQYCLYYTQKRRNATLGREKTDLRETVYGVTMVFRQKGLDM